MKKPQFLTAVLVIACIIGGAMVGLMVFRHQEIKPPAHPGIEGLLWPSPRSLMPFTVTDHHGRPFALEQLSGKWSLLFFGFTHCPDICPITLSVLRDFYGKLAGANAAGDVQIIFVTVDPARDTPEQVANYVRYFHEQFIGLTGTEEQIATLTGQLGVLSYKVDNNENYAVDHSASVFLISPAGAWVGIFSPPQQAEDIHARFNAIRKFIDSQNK